MAIDIPTGIHAALKVFGARDAQAEDGALVLPALCEMTDGVVTLKSTGEAIESAKSREWLEKNKPHLLPAKFERSLADRAFIDGALTARGALLKQVGYDEATRIAREYGLKSIHDTRRGTAPAGTVDTMKNGNGNHSTNPFHKSNWNISAQGALLRALGPEKTAAIAASVGVRIGSTSPNPNF